MTFGVVHRAKLDFEFLIRIEVSSYMRLTSASSRKSIILRTFEQTVPLG